MGLRPVVGNSDWFTAFQPQGFVGLGFVYHLLRQLYRCDICCHFPGSFPAYVAGLQTSYHLATVFVALQENPLINLIFQKSEELVQTFNIGPFQFTLEKVEVCMAVCRYRVKRGRFGVMVGFIGVHSWVPCGNYSNVDFVHFIWQYFEQFGFRGHAITILPATFTRSPLSNRLILLCLRHYRDASTGWSIYSGCVTCRDEFRDDVGPFTGCRALDETCSCRVCRRQPPSLQDMVSNVVFSLVYNIDRFAVTRDVTFDHYVYSVDSKRVDVWRLLPPDFPSITLEFQFECCTLHKIHTVLSVRRCIPPLSTSSSQKWMRSRLSRHCDADSGVLIAKSRYSIQLTLQYTRTSKIRFPIDRIHEPKSEIHSSVKILNCGRCLR